MAGGADDPGWFLSDMPRTGEQTAGPEAEEAVGPLRPAQGQAPEPGPGLGAQGPGQAGGSAPVHRPADAPGSGRTRGATAGTDPALRTRYRRILSFAARALVQTWWYEISLPRIGFARVAERSRDGPDADGSRGASTRSRSSSAAS